MQREIEWLYLLPEPIELHAKLLLRHVVLGAPHDARIRKPELACTLVGELDEAGVALPHRRRYFVPPDPHVFQLVGIAARSQDLGELVDPEALFLASLLAAVFPLAIVRAEGSGDLRQLLTFGIVIRRRRDERQLEQRQLPRNLLGEPWRFVLPSLERETRYRRSEIRISLGDEGLCIVRDVGLLYPCDSAQALRQAIQRLLGGVDEAARIVGSGRPSAVRSRWACLRTSDDDRECGRKGDGGPDPEVPSNPHERDCIAAMPRSERIAGRLTSTTQSSGGRANNRIREACRGPTGRADVEKRFVDLQLHQDELLVTLDPVDAGIEQRSGRM